MMSGTMALNVPGLLAMVGFYMLILGTGIYASLRSRREEKKWTGHGLEITLLAGRKINLIVGIFTLTATWVGGGFILGIAEATYNPTLGAVWALMPVPYVLTFFLGGFFFAKPMREKKYLTMMDPFQKKYGNGVATALIFPALIADVLWVARTLVSLGGTMRVILDLPYVYSILISSVVAIVYTLLGGLYSVAYTDVIQLSLILVSLALGGLAYQAFYQRILASSSYTQAQLTCFVSSSFCLVLGIPSILIGAVAASTNWNSTAYGLPTPYERGEAGSVLPIALQYLTPTYVSIIGIGAVAAAVMSSMDSALLSSASLFSSNIYKNMIRKQASDYEMRLVIRISVVVVGLVGTGLCFLDSSVLVFWLVGVDMSFTIMFPQLVCVLFFEVSNSYGATMGLIVGVLMRALSGEPLIGLKPVIPYPGLRLNRENTLTQYFPFRTTIMLMSLLSILLFSWLAVMIFDKKLLSKKWDVYHINSGRESPEDNRARENAVVSKRLMETSC
uniref:high affinity choline transporter 1-like isoform X4 n=1 Tax=Doryrhamphus excisus TaxID=161450 RepID=UPI0025AE22F6|nr:high affinity choline transporter 1-like isoform X4 [Doryrhamphus excisus]